MSINDLMELIGYDPKEKTFKHEHFMLVDDTKMKICDITNALDHRVDYNLLNELQKEARVNSYVQSRREDSLLVQDERSNFREEIAPLQYQQENRAINLNLAMRVHDNSYNPWHYSTNIFECIYGVAVCDRNSCTERCSVNRRSNRRPLNDLSQPTIILPQTGIVYDIDTYTQNEIQRLQDGHNIKHRIFEGSDWHSDSVVFYTSDDLYDDFIFGQTERKREKG